MRLITEKASDDTPKLALENIESWTGRYVETATEFQGDGTSFQPGDVLFGKLRPYLAKALLADASGQAVGDFHVLRPTAELDGRFARYYVLSRDFIAVVDGSTYGAKMPRASWEFMSNLPLLLPPLPEQIAIAAFLDRETGKIDALVEEQRRLVDLLKEKRQSVISRAVTKGLNPHAKMKPSEVEWLGEVPEHWEVVQLKRLFSSTDYGISDNLEQEGAVAVLRMGNIQDGKVDVDDLKYVDQVDASLLLRADDLLYNRTNSLDLIGKVGRFEQRDGPTTFASYLVRLRTSNSSDPRFMAYLLNTKGLLGVARSRAFVAIGQCNLNPTRYGEILVAHPPLSEQQAIVSDLDQKVSQVDQLVGEAMRALELLRERRAALISAAVTGKIDLSATEAEEIAS